MDMRVSEAPGMCSTLFMWRLELMGRVPWMPEPLMMVSGAIPWTREGGHVDGFCSSCWCGVRWIVAAESSMAECGLVVEGVGGNKGNNDVVDDKALFNSHPTSLTLLTTVLGTGLL